MADHESRDERQSSLSGDAGEAGSTLLPMLVGGLVLVVIGAVIVMVFV
jgi:hypothetical protein